MRLKHDFPLLSELDVNCQAAEKFPLRDSSVAIIFAIDDGLRSINRCPTSG